MKAVENEEMPNTNNGDVRTFATSEIFDIPTESLEQIRKHFANIQSAGEHLQKIAEAHRLLEHTPLSTAEANYQTAQMALNGQVLREMAELGLKPSEWEFDPSVDPPRFVKIKK